jgi:endonuclease-8
VPEGDTIFRAARTLHRALAGRIVTRFESVYPALTRVDHDTPIRGRSVERVSSRGKHLLMAFSGDLVLHTHMRMHGSWHIYRNGERWRAPAHDMRVVVGTNAYVAIAFNVPVAEFLTGVELARHPQIHALGPDLTDPSFDRGDVRRRFSEHSTEPLHDVLLNQRVLAGIGNVLKSEVLFVARLNPFAEAGGLSPDAFDRLMDVSLKLMKANIIESVRMTPVVGRRTTGSLDPDAKLFVYGRGGKACRVCGTAVKARKTGVDARLTYWCPTCQASPDERSPASPSAHDGGD